MPLSYDLAPFQISRAEIVKFFRWYFGWNNDTKRTFRNKLTFSKNILLNVLQNWGHTNPPFAYPWRLNRLDSSVFFFKWVYMKTFLFSIFFSGSTVAPGGGGCDNKAYDPEETSEGSSIASCAHSPHLNGKKVRKIS